VCRSTREDKRRVEVEVGVEVEGEGSVFS